MTPRKIYPEPKTHCVRARFRHWVYKLVPQSLVFVLVLLSFSANAYAATTITSSATVTGDANVVGALSKGSGSFVIDHPLDPKNKLLYHSFVESPDVKNIYDGIAVLDEKGKATVELPGYFLALNKDFRYLLMPLGAPAPDIHISKEIRKKYWGIFGAPIFEISGGNPGQEISWQISATRHDPLILKYPIKVEVEKGPGELVNKGEYIFKDYEKK